ncbi:Lactaldehyde dehydrogenase [Thermoplasmatales archaeon]|nr:Lactaldehyde dehydrogenase [Thermoplasmatales archaeon]
MFDNENTFIKMRDSGKEKEFDSLYENALKQAESYFSKEYPNLANGEVREKQKIKDISPIDGKEIATFQMSSPETVEKTLKILHSSYRNWYNFGYVERSRILLNAADIMSKRKFLLAALLAYENGKNRYEAMGDVDEAIDFMRFYSLNLLENEGFAKFTGKGYKNEESQSIMKPYGVFAVIPPFNFYSITIGMTVGPLVVGNSVVLKPSSDIPLSSYLGIKILHEAGVPENVLAYLAGSGSIVGQKLSESELVSGFVFTGSREVGMSLYRKATEKHPRVVVTEMGGKDAIIVSSKADLSKAVEGTARAAFGYSGQKCSACSLVYVHESVYDKFVPMLVERVKKMQVGDPRKKDTFVTPVVNAGAFEKYRSLIPKISKEGKILLGGKAMDGDGYYVEPTVVADLKDDSFVLKDELFLPILAISKVKSIDEAIQKVNSSDYGLTGGLFSEDLSEIEKYFASADVGVLYANRTSGGSTGAMVGSQPFVGWKMSGVSGKGTGSFYYLQQFLREQSQTIAH